MTLLLVIRIRWIRLTSKEDRIMTKGIVYDIEVSSLCEWVSMINPCYEEGDHEFVYVNLHDLNSDVSYVRVLEVYDDEVIEDLKDWEDWKTCGTDAKLTENDLKPMDELGIDMSEWIEFHTLSYDKDGGLRWK